MSFTTPIHTNEQSVDRVLRAGLPTLMVFWRSRDCAPCEQINPALNRLAAAFAGELLIAKVDVASNERLVAQYDPSPRQERPMAGIIEVTDTNFQAEVLEADQPVLVDFWAPWCGPCRVVAPVLEEIAGERDDLRIVKLNTDENPQTAGSYGIMSIPTMILFKHGQPVKQIVGAKPKRALEAELVPALA